MTTSQGLGSKLTVVQSRYSWHGAVRYVSLVISSLPFIADTGSPVAMRDLYMKTGQGFLLVFSIASRASFEELEMLRDDIIRIKDDEDIPIVIVGNKADLEDQRAVDRAKAFSLSQRWSAPYYETSARTRSRYHRKQ